MSSFADRLRAEIEYLGLLQKEVAFRAGIKKRALDMYLGVQASMPPADVAVRLAKVLGVTVEYLVTGEKDSRKPEDRRLRLLENDIKILPGYLADAVTTMIHTAAEHEREKAGRNAPERTD